MRYSILFLALLAACYELRAAKALRGDDVILYVDGNGPAAPVNYTARTLVTWMFTRIGIHLAWSDGTPNPKASINILPIRIRFLTEVQAQCSPDALAYTYPFSDGVVTIAVVYTRLQHLAGRSTREPALLAHVIAHELGHALQGTNAHAETGIMKARWSGQDYDAMSRRPLEFTPVDADLMIAGLQAMRNGSRARASHPVDRPGK